MSAADPYGLIGQVLDGQFRVDRIVGEGGFSAVYRGHHLGLDEPIAVKCLKLPGALGSALVESFVRRFREESRLHYRLSQGSLAIARSIASGTTMSPSTSALVPYMVLEWLDGRSLAQDFEERKQRGLHGRTLDETMKTLDSAAQALAFAHAQGVVHRDVNPGNLFLAETRQGAMTKVLDFGVAKVFSDRALELGPRAQTIGQIRIFAPAYGSPEQFDDSVGKVGPASDAYSLALIALEMLRDAPVREGEHIGEFAMAALDAGKKPTPRALGIPVGDAVEETFAKATAMRPDDRFPDVGAMWGSLKNAIRVDAESGRAPHANASASARAGWKLHSPAAGEPPPDRPVTADMPAPVVEVARQGSVAPAPVVATSEPPRVPRMLAQTVRMTTSQPPPAVEPAPQGSVPPPAVASGASALGATPLTSTLMMDNAPRILTPVPPPTTRTGQAPSPMAHASRCRPPRTPRRPRPSITLRRAGCRRRRRRSPRRRPLRSRSRSRSRSRCRRRRSRPRRRSRTARRRLRLRRPILSSAAASGALRRAEVPTVVPPPPASRALIAVAVAFVVTVLATGAAFAVYHFFFANP